MPRPLRNIPVCAWMALLLLAPGLSACGNGGSEAVVAKVDGHSITKAQFTHWLSVQGGATASSSSPQDAGLKRRVMEALISAQWTLAEASKLGVSVSNGEAEQQLQVLDYAANTAQASGQLFRREAELKKSLSARGLTHADRVWLMKLNLLGTKVEQKSRQLAEQAVTHAQIAKYYEGHRQRYVVGEERDYVFIPTFTRANSEKARREIEAGKDFFAVQKRVSIDPPELSGLRHLKRGEGDPVFTPRVFRARPHVLLGPTPLGQIWDIYEVRKIIPRHQEPLASAESRIRRTLASRRLGHLPTRLSAALASAWRTRTKCSAGYVVPLCGGRARAG